MTREEAINKWVIPAIKNTWNEKKCKEILEALKQEPCEDAVSRQAVIKAIDEVGLLTCEYIDVKQAIESLLSVQPTRPKGEWIGSAMLGTLRCSRCYGDCPMDGDFYHRTDFCPDCGADMRGEENGQHR